MIRAYECQLRALMMRQASCERGPFTLRILYRLYRLDSERANEDRPGATDEAGEMLGTEGGAHKRRRHTSMILRRWETSPGR